jgi:DNA-binding NarL/FixJ family response regulator
MHKTPELVLAAFSAGADSYCMKDISVDKLVESDYSTHEGNPWIDPAIAKIVLQQVRQNVPVGGAAEVENSGNSRTLTQNIVNYWKMRP